MPRPDKAGLALLLAAIALAGCTAPGGDVATTAGEASTATRIATSTPVNLGYPLRIMEVAVVPDSADLGQHVTARALVKNVGDAAATGKVEFLLATQVQSSALVTLEPGASTVAIGPVRPGRTGTLPLQARMVESGEARTTQLLVHGPHLVDANITIMDLQQCDRVAHRVSFRNAGDGAALGVRVEAQLRGTDGAVVDAIEQAIGDLRPNQSTLVEFTHVAPARCPVPHTYTVHVVVDAQAGVRMEHDSAPFTV